MSKLKKILPVALLAAAPIAYHQFNRKKLNAQQSAAGLKPLPLTMLPGNDFYIREDHFAQHMAEIVLPYITARAEVSAFRTTHSINYAYYRADRPSASVVISHGFAEYMGRYSEVIYYFLKMGYDVYIPEHFGHGDSDAGVTDPALVWVADFNEYTFDFYHFIKQIVRPKNPALPIIGYGHSMGGAILARTLEQYPDLCDAAIFTSPMFKVFLLQSEGLIFPLVQALGKAPLSKTSVPGKTPTENLKLGDFLPEKAAMHSQARGRYFHELRLSTGKPPRWAVSWGWLAEAIKATHQIVKPENIEKINIPLLMFESGQDWFVDPRGIAEFARYAKNLEFYKVAGSYHEIYSETDDIIVPYFNVINDFITKFQDSAK